MGRTQINCRLGAEQKERWQNHVEESRYDDSITDLVKRAVENQIDRDSGEQEPAAPSRSAEPASEVVDKIQGLQNEIQSLEQEVSRAVDAVHGQEGIDQDLPPEVYTALPVGEENAQTVEELVSEAEHAFSEAQARFALEHLARNMGGSVQRIPDGLPAANQDVRWYKEE